MKTKRNYLATGLKLLALNFIAAVIAWIFAILLGLSLTSIAEMTSFLAFLFIIIVIAIIIFINGWLAQKIWGWD